MRTPVLSPRLLAAGWGIWAMLTAAAYVHGVPAALDPIADMLPTMSVAATWAIASIALLIGAIAPHSGTCGRIGRTARVVGIALVTGLLAAWTVSYAVDALEHGSRLWISSKNYGALTVAALASAYKMARGAPGRRRDAQ